MKSAKKDKASIRDAIDYDTSTLHPTLYAETLLRNYSAHFFRWSFARRAITPNDDVLEIGCGADYPLLRILTGGAYAKYNTYVGVDMHPLPHINRLNSSLIGEFNFVERWRELQTDKYGYSRVIHFEVIEHMRVEFAREMLRGCYELLSDDGEMYLSTPCYDGVRHAYNHVHEYTIPEMAAMLNDAGFEVTRRYGSFIDIRHIERSDDAAIKSVYKRLKEYFDNHALSCFFAPIMPDNARDCLWVCKKRQE